MHIPSCQLGGGKHEFQDKHVLPMLKRMRVSESELRSFDYSIINTQPWGRWYRKKISIHTHTHTHELKHTDWSDSNLPAMNNACVKGLLSTHLQSTPLPVLQQAAPPYSYGELIASLSRTCTTKWLTYTERNIVWEWTDFIHQWGLQGA